MAEPIFQRLALIGIGLIGGSIALGARKYNLAGHVAVSSRTEKTLARAKELGLGDSWHHDPKEAVKDAD
jgi:cyclohexadieny/prephenate dehydrogenase